METRVTLLGDPVMLNAMKSFVASVVLVQLLGAEVVNCEEDRLGLVPAPTMELEGTALLALRTSIVTEPDWSAITHQLVMVIGKGM